MKLIKQIIKNKYTLILPITVYVLLITPKFFNNKILAQTALGVSAIPPRLEISIKPGEITTKYIKVRNESSNERLITTEIKDFIVNDDKGTPVEVSPKEANKNRWAASQWITVSPNSIKLKSGETKNLLVTINAPENALPGGHYAMILHTPDNKVVLTETGSSVKAQVGTLVYVSVAGQIKQDAQIKEFKAPSFLEFGPVNFQAIIKNLSDIHITPDGGITVSNMIGGKTILPLTKTNIFPYTEREFQNILDKKWLFGRYQAQLNASYGTEGNTLTSTLFFWVIPWRLIVLLVAAVAIIIALILINKNKPKSPSAQQLEKEIAALKDKYKDRK